MIGKHYAEDGFTLIELILAMTIFSLVLIIMTGSFIGLTRSYSREQNKKQLSEALQLVVEDITRSLRSANNSAFEQCDVISNGTPYKALYFSGGTRYLWAKNKDDQGNLVDTFAGFYKQANRGSCGDGDVAANRETLLDDRYYIRNFAIGALNNINGAYKINLLATTRLSGIDTSGNTPRCDGSSNPESRSCAVQKIETIVNVRGN